MNYQEKYTEWITSDYFDEKTKDYQIIGTEKIHFSDQEEVEKYIREHTHD